MCVHVFHEWTNTGIALGNCLLDSMFLLMSHDGRSIRECQNCTMLRQTKIPLCERTNDNVRLKQTRPTRDPNVQTFPQVIKKKKKTKQTNKKRLESQFCAWNEDQDREDYGKVSRGIHRSSARSLAWTLLSITRYIFWKRAPRP